MTDQNDLVLPGGRNFESSISKSNLASIQAGHVNYTYKNRKLLKNPFDFALYIKLIYDVSPRTIIEVGSFDGGSALWFADMFRTYDIDGHIFSIDINPVQGIDDSLITFMEGDALDLGAVLPRAAMQHLPRPLLVIEDSLHLYETSLAVLDFFDEHLHVGERIVVEDGIVHDLGLDKYRNGPNRAIGDFLAKTQGRYMIDSEYCDFFGHNMTWNTNGYLKKIG